MIVLPGKDEDIARLNEIAEAYKPASSSSRWG